MGSGPYFSFTNVVRSNDADIDALLYGSRWYYNTISYSFPTSSSQYQYNVPSGVFIPFNSLQQSVTRWALDEAYGGAYSVEGFTALTVLDAGATGNGALRFANRTDAPTAYGYYPGNTAQAGDAFFGPSVYGNSTVVEKRALPGSYHFATILHEAGHALGLKHPHEWGRSTDFGGMNRQWDNLEYTVMSYREHSGESTDGYQRLDLFYFPQTYMMLDIRALQYLYGADFTARRENTTYAWDGAGNSYVNGTRTLDPVANVIFQTIWDGNGVDTYDLSNYSTNILLDLRPGQYSNFGTQLALLGGDVYARGNVYNALQVGSDVRSLIENAWAGVGHDRLIGNAAGNYLWGNAGNDTLEGGAGNDTLDGGAGQDRMWGGGGNDKFVFRFLGDYRAGSPDIINDMGGVGAAGGDVIDISAIDANASLAGNQTFSAGRAAIGGMRTVNNGSYTEVQLFVNAASGADFYIWLNDGAVTANDYRTTEFFL